MRVLVVARQLSYVEGVGGLERAVARQVDELLDSGHSVTVLTSRVVGKVSERAGLQHRVTRWPTPISRFWKPTFGIAATLWTSRVSWLLPSMLPDHDVIYLHGVAAGLLKSYLSIPTVVNPHGMEEFAMRPLTHQVTRVFLRRLCRRAVNASSVIATDVSLIAVVMRNLGIARDHVTLIPNAVDIGRLDALAARSTAPLDIRSGLRIVSVGRLTRNKGYDLLLNALKSDRVRDSMPDAWTWTHYGDGYERASLVADAMASPKVQLSILSNRSDAEVQTAIAQARIFVQPSRDEGSSLTTLEAMAHGTTVVATPVGGIPDKIVEGVTGFLATEATAEALADALVRALAPGAARVGQSARELVKLRFSSTAEASAYEALFERLIGMKSPSGGPKP